MAEINTVPLGRAGTGSAFVLGQSQAAGQLLDTIQYNQQIAQQQEKLKLAQAQQLANSWKTNQLKVDGGLYWQPEFNKRYQSHLQKGIELKQMGVDPFNYNPNDTNQAKIAEDYLLERQGILADTKNREATETYLKGLSDKINANPSKYYGKDIEAFHNFTQTPYEKAKTMTLPTLTEQFNPSVVLDKLTPAQVESDIIVGDRRIKSVKALPEETRSAIVSAYKNNAETARWVDELTGGQGFTIPVLESIPNTKEAVKSKLEAQYKGNPDLRAQLATQGILPNSDAYKEYVDQESTRLYDAKSKWNNQLQGDLNQLLPKVKGMSSNLPDYGERRMALAENANRRANARFSAWESDKKEKGTYDQFLKDVTTLKPNAINELKAVVNEIGANVRKVYDENITIDGKKKRVKNALIIDVPVETTVRVKDIDGKDVVDSDGAYKTKKSTVNKRYVIGSQIGGRQSEIVLNQILNRAKSFGAEKQNKVTPYEEETTIEGWEE